MGFVESAVVSAPTLKDEGSNPFGYANKNPQNRMAMGIWRTRRDSNARPSESERTRRHFQQIPQQSRNLDFRLCYGIFRMSIAFRFVPFCLLCYRVIVVKL